ncbi:MAG: hypothetical protein R6T91_03030 [Bacteroidales bacterium]
MWKRALLYWWPLAVFNTANVLLREFFLDTLIGETAANLAAVFFMVIVTLLYTWLVVVKMRPSGLWNALMYGAWWVLFTFVAQVIFNLIIKGWSVKLFIHSFNFQNSPCWLAIYLSMFLSPFLMYVFRYKAIRL